jgi:protein-tyrosine phosphatase
MKVLFVCSGNICRSVMAERILKKLSKQYNIKHLEVDSCGILKVDNFPMPQEMIMVLKEEKIEQIAHVPKVINEELVNWADIILVMEKIHLEYIQNNFPAATKKTHLLKEYAQIEDENKEIRDPIGSDYNEYLNCLHEIKISINKLLDRWYKIQDGKNKNKAISE